MSKLLTHIITTTFTTIISFVAVSAVMVYAVGLPTSQPSGEPANDGLYGHFLRSILGHSASLTTYTGDGTVKNADTLDGYDSAVFQRKVQAQLCPAGQYVVSIGADGSLDCR